MRPLPNGNDGVKVVVLLLCRLFSGSDVPVTLTGLLQLVYQLVRDVEPQAVECFPLASEPNERPNLPFSSRRFASLEVRDPFATTVLEAVVVQTKLTD